MSQEAGIDVRLGELAGAIQETMESYEVEIGNKVIPGLLFYSFSEGA
jgi:methionyl aminopeptidase